MRMNGASDWVRIDGHANSMFRFEYLHDAWIDKCAAYLRTVFGDRIRGATVIDYAFGRGNWALAFIRAGAAFVYAIDASSSNVKRFRAYCHKAKVKNIDVIHGNILVDPIIIKADIVWVYGILPHIKAADRFVARLATLARDKQTLFLFYAYKAGSLRELVVTHARSKINCHSEAEFRQLSFSFTPAARMRARDDLTAPFIRWYSAPELCRLFDRHGLRPVREVEGFDEFLGNKTVCTEFSPFHIVCQKIGSRKAAVARHPIRESKVPITDILIVRQLANAIFRSRTVDDRSKQRIALGLFNTHFSALYCPTKQGKLFVEDFLFLLYAAVIAGIKTKKLPQPASQICGAALDSLKGSSIRVSKNITRSSAIAAYLARNRIRL